MPPDVAESMLRGLATSFVVSGAIDPRGMSEEEFREAVAAHLAELAVALRDIDPNDPNGTGESWLQITLDHQDGILEDARRFVDEEKYDHAVVMYATWIEHWINWMLGWKFDRTEADRKALDQLMRFGLAQKLGVAWLLTFEEPFDTQLANQILRIAEVRNGYVHYKWRSFDANQPPDEIADARRQSDLAEEVIAKLDALRDEVALGGAAQWLSRSEASFFIPVSDED
jgi:hypothetical protein